MQNNQLIANRFELQGLIGQGGMGQVYRANDTQTGEIVAIKALNPEILAHDPGLLERFVREGKALQQLNHPNIVHMLASVEDDGSHYLVMEYVEGGSLQDLLREKCQLPSEQVIQIALDLADALTRAHRLGIIHRDLKPANVLLAADGTPRLADFGIAHITNHAPLTESGIIIGTLDYLSPELCRGEMPDERSDIWSFGVMLFQMLAGKIPFEGATMLAKLNAILAQKVPDLIQFAPGTPESLVDLVYRMLEKERLQRTPSVRLVGAELEAIQKGRELMTPSSTSQAADRFESLTPVTGMSQHNLPVQTTPFVGREIELQEIARLLADPSVRLLTILGIGGMGKTRLSIEAGQMESGNFKNGVSFVPLAGVQSADMLVPTIAQVLGFSFSKDGEPRQQLLNYLREKHQLLILDNFEHLVEGAGLICDILRSAPMVKVLVTSRVKLNVQDEHPFHLHGMDFPDWETPADALEYSAVKLFMQGARRAKPGFELVADDLMYMARICRLVGGIPLGILLAAAWVKMLSLLEIAKEIEQNIAFLETSLSDIPERQRNMQAVFDYSRNLLTEHEKDVFRRLSVFQGGFTREAVQQVTGVSLRELMELVDLSLLFRAPTGRYSMHDLLHQYAQGKLAASNEEKNIRGHHLEYYLSLAEQFDREQNILDQADWMQCIAVEIKNIRAAMAWSITAGRAQEGLHLALCLIWFWRSTVYSREGRDWLQRLLAENPQPSLDRVSAFRQLANFADDAGDNLQEITLREQALAVAEELGDRAIIALTSNTLAAKLFGNGDTIRAQQFAERSLKLCQGQSEMQVQEAACILLMGELAHCAGDPVRAHELHEQALDIYRNLHKPEEAAWALLDLGDQAWLRNDLVRARLLHEESLALWRFLNNPLCLGVELLNLGSVLVALGECERGQALLNESLALLMDLNSNLVNWPLQGLAILAHMRGHFLRAARLLGAEDALRRPTGRGITQEIRDTYESTLSSLHGQLNDEAFAAAWSEGQAMSLQEVAALAMSNEP